LNSTALSAGFLPEAKETGWTPIIPRGTGRFADPLRPFPVRDPGKSTNKHIRTAHSRPLDPMRWRRYVGGGPWRLDSLGVE